MVPNNGWKRLVLAKLALTVLALTGCAYVRNIPAEATPERTARYYRTQDAANLAAGAGVALLFNTTVCKGPAQHREYVNHYFTDSANVVAYRTLRRKWYTGGECPVLAVMTVGALGTLRRQLAPDYRESGLFMNVYGAMATMVAKFAVTAFAKRWDSDR